MVSLGLPTEMTAADWNPFGDHPPLCLDEIYKLVGRYVRESVSYIDRIQVRYHDEHGSLTDEVRYWLPLLQKASSLTEINYVRSFRDFERVMVCINTDQTMRGDPENARLVDELRRLQMKIEKYLPSKFLDLSVTMKAIEQVLRKYCVSFYNPATDVAYDTAIDYEEKIAAWHESIIHNVDTLMRLNGKYRNEMIVMDDLGSKVRSQVAVNDAAQYLVLFLIPDVCNAFRSGLGSMADWIREDENYCQFLHKDISHLKALKTDLERELQRTNQQCHQLTFRIKRAKRDCEQKESEVFELKKIEPALHNKEENIAHETRGVLISMEVKEHQKYQIGRRRKKASVAGVTDASVTILWDHLIKELHEMNKKLSLLKRDLKNTRCQLFYLRRKQKQLDQLLADIRLFQLRVEELKEAQRDLTKKIETTSQQIRLAKTLYFYKSSPDPLTRIFHNMPARGPCHVKEEQISYSSADLNNAIDIVAREIGDHWIPLYLSLPFDPPRGVETISNDEEICLYAHKVQHILRYGTFAGRSDTRENACRALTKWRRYHTKVKISDLKVGLIQIGRSDIWNRIKNKLSMDDQEPEEEEKLPPVAPHLIPYYRLVVRFDELKDSGYFEKLWREQDDREQQYLHANDIDCKELDDATV